MRPRLARLKACWSRLSAAWRRWRRSSITSGATWSGERRGGGAGARAVLERKGLGVADRVDEAERLGELGVGLAGEADDEVARQRDVRARARGRGRAGAGSSRGCGGGSSRAARGRCPPARADGGTASGSRRRGARRSGPASCRWGGWSCSGCAPARGSRSSARIRSCRPRFSVALQALTFWPSSVISRAPASTSACASSTIASKRRLTSAPRV